MEAEFRGEMLKVEAHSSECPNCGRVVLTGRDRRAYHRAVSDAYRRAHGLRTAGDIDRLRRGLGMTWRQFSNFTSISLATLKRWMGGEIQSESMDLLLKLAADLKAVQQRTEELIQAQLSNGPGTVEDPGSLCVIKAVRRDRFKIEVEPVAADSQLELCA